MTATPPPSPGTLEEAGHTPTQEQIDIAVLWLESNEGEGDEHAACVAVAEWLKRRAADRMLRSEARKAGVPVRALRARLVELGGRK